MVVLGTYEVVESGAAGDVPFALGRQIDLLHDRFVVAENGESGVRRSELHELVEVLETAQLDVLVLDEFVAHLKPTLVLMNPQQIPPSNKP